jgi:diadenosine tetraphosphatase ApaH/serine/threonine PP2A family protein phosphatase
VRYGILGDIHANLPALEAVLADLEGQEVERVLCLGDVVGYGAEPAACIERVRGLEPAIVAGNHDWAVAERLSLDFFNSAARAAIEWTRRNLSARDVAWLGDLPLVHEEEGILLVHSTVHDPHVFDYLQTPYDAYLSFQALEHDTAFVGHSHVPITFFDGTPVTYSVDERVSLRGRRTISNVGSVGQPRDEDPRAAYGILDSDAMTLDVRRVSYDVETTIGRIRDAGLPFVLGERLRFGR